MLPLVQGKTGADASCTVSARAAGGQVFEGTTAVSETSCPAGSYGVDNQYCLPWCASLSGCMCSSTHALPWAGRCSAPLYDAPVPA